MDTQSEFDVLSRDECHAMLSLVEVGRVAFSYRALPAIVPVTFGVDDDALVIRTTNGSRLAMAGDGAVVSFEIDDLEPGLRAGWSVVITGQASQLRNSEEIARWRERINPWVPGPRDYFLRLPMTIVTGRRILPAAGGSTHVYVGRP